MFVVPLYRQWKTSPLAVIVIMTTFTFGIRFRFDTAEFYETSFNLEYHGSFRFTLTPTNYTDYCDPNWLFERK